MASGKEPTWEAFRARVLDRASLRKDPPFLRYVEGVSERMWRHVHGEENLSPETAEARLFGFYQEDRRFFTES